MRKHCIYVITNKINGKKYVGQTCQFEIRKRQHINRNKSVISEAINKYGVENFDFEIIHNELTQKEANEWEVYYINEVYNTYKGEGYNSSLGGGVVSGEDNPMYGTKHDEEWKKTVSEKVKEDKNPRAILTKEQAVQIYKEYRNTTKIQKEIAKKFNISRTVVGKIIRGEHWATKDKDSLTRGVEGCFNSNSKVDKKTSLEIYKEYKNKKHSIKELSNKYNLSKKVIIKIKNGEHWTTKHENKLNNKRENLSKITEESALEIYNKYKNNRITYKELSKEYGFYWGHIGRICRGEHWATENIE